MFDPSQPALTHGVKRIRRGLFPIRVGVLAVLCALASLDVVHARHVMVMSLGFDRAELVIDRLTIRKLAAGQSSPEGVLLISATRDAAVVEVDGKRYTLRLGESTAAVAMLRANAQGQFIVAAAINGRETQVIVDTGATVVAMNWIEAARLGVVWDTTRPVRTQTAGGERIAFPATLAAVQVGAIAMTNVQAVVYGGGPEQLPIVLLGMSFLRHVEMVRAGETLTLTLRH
ncbi:MAG: TIGR02281 family clan AA aspartic protease [Burkholderiales bacterium]